MVTREVPFVGNSSFLFSWKNMNAFREAYGIKTLEDFDKFYSQANTAKLTFDDVAKIASFGLQRKDKTVSKEDVDDLIDEYMEEHTFTDFFELVLTAQMTSMYSPNQDVGEAKGEKKPPKPGKN